MSDASLCSVVTCRDKGAAEVYANVCRMPSGITHWRASATNERPRQPLKAADKQVGFPAPEPSVVPSPCRITLDSLCGTFAEG